MAAKPPEPMPTVLYKYCGPDRLDVLRNRVIRFTQRDELNDIYELRPRVVFNSSWADRGRAKLAVSHLEVRGVPKTTAPEHENDVDYTLQHALVLSLSSQWDILPMWSYYADGHKGLVIGFDNSRFLATGTTGPVQYSDEFPIAETDFKSIFCKCAQWRHEHEWRSFRVLTKDKPDRTVCDRIHLFGFSPADVAEVILGNRMSEEHVCMATDILSAPEYEHVRVFRAIPDPNNWTLERHLLMQK